MLSCALDGDIQHVYAEIQGQVDSERARNESLNAERLALAEKAMGAGVESR